MRTRTKFTLLLLLAMWFKIDGTLLAFPRPCSSVCSSSTDCNTMCYVSDFDFQNGTTATCLDYGVYGSCPGTPTPTPGDGTAGSGSGSHCGNNSCESGECDSCPADCAGQCGVCGDSVCDPTEYGGYGNGNQQPACGPQALWCEYCGEDCGECDPAACFPQACGGEESRYQCRACHDDGECAFGWCASGFGRSNQCETTCGDDYQCPTSYFCVAGDCVLVPQ